MKKKLWGGRFTKKTDPLVEDFTRSIQFDRKLAEQDCKGSLMHIDILRKANLLNSRDHAILKKGLKGVLSLVKDPSFHADDSFEDIHSYIQHLLEKKVGKVALKLHTCRSRNDQVVFDTKYYCLEQALWSAGLIRDVCEELNRISKKHKDIPMPGYTHLQHAMPLRLSDIFGAYAEMLSRDERRLVNAIRNLNITFGSGALAGTMIDSSHYDSVVKKAYPELKSCQQKGATRNSIDAVSDRDFVIEILSALSITGMHLSRLAEDLILWSTKEFDFIDIDEAFCTGSSLMPHKKNPDVLELIRGYSGRLYANLLDVLVTMKGLPLSYNRDMQLDKEPLFGSFEIVQKELKVLAGLLPRIIFKKENIARQLEDECLYATDMADYLVQKGVSFKEAHTIVGRLINYKFKSGKEIKAMGDTTLKKFHPSLNSKTLKRIIDPKRSVRSKRSIKRNKTHC